MKTIKDYIQFAIDNGYEDIDYIGGISGNNLGHADYDFNEICGEFIEGSSEDFKSSFTSIIDIITSKLFIEAIARGVWDKGGNSKRKKDYENVYVFYKKIGSKWFKNLKGLEDYLTAKQAVAVRDGELDLFVKELLCE